MVNIPSPNCSISQQWTLVPTVYSTKERLDMLEKGIIICCRWKLNAGSSNRWHGHCTKCGTSLHKKWKFRLPQQSAWWFHPSGTQRCIAAWHVKRTYIMSGTRHSEMRHHITEEHKALHNKITTIRHTHCVLTLTLLLAACYVTAGLCYCHLEHGTSLHISINF